MNSKDLMNRLIDFSVLTIKMTRQLPKEYAFDHLTKQIIRSSTSSALNYGEALAGESRKDFTHKLKLSLKELRETDVNLKILQKLNDSNSKSKSKLINECNELISIFVSSIKTLDKSKIKIQKS